jgi:AraC-like DNA-binding protein
MSSIATHGMSNTPTYHSWEAMIQRCTNEDHHSFEDYGGRGITICVGWFSFRRFFKDMGVRPEGKTLDRLNGDGNYTPKNCRWSTLEEQNNNRRNTRRITFLGECLSLKQWARRLGMYDCTLQHRLDHHGWSIERALTTPTAKRRNQWKTS